MSQIAIIAGAFLLVSAWQLGGCQSGQEGETARGSNEPVAHEPVTQGRASDAAASRMAASDDAASHDGAVYDGGAAQQGDEMRAKENTEMSEERDEAARWSSAGYEVAVLAGGCFWGMEEILRDVPGVVDSEVGYSGGTMADPTYNDVKRGTSGHAEAVRIVFDPGRLAYADLLEKWFFRMHDPTTRDRQGNDVGSQYRSAIFFTTSEQARIAREVLQRVEDSGVWQGDAGQDRPIVTQIAAAGPFTPAEDFHQDYLQRSPAGYTCHYLREF